MKVKGSFTIKMNRLTDKEYNDLPGYECLNCKGICKYDFSVIGLKSMNEQIKNGCRDCDSHNLKLIKGNK